MAHFLNQKTKPLSPEIKDFAMRLMEALSDAAELDEGATHEDEALADALLCVHNAVGAALGSYGRKSPDEGE